VKATTTERLGFTGRIEGIAAQGGGGRAVAGGEAIQSDIHGLVHR
jgi:hypothetical protein